jgi:hypothetical protein
MSNKIAGIVIPSRTRLSRRDLLGFAAKGAASVVVSQSMLLACAADASSATDTSSANNGGTTTGTGNATCVLTAALTEGPFFVDEMLNRSDIRTDPITGGLHGDSPHPHLQRDARRQQRLHAFNRGVPGCLALRRCRDLFGCVRLF